MDEAYVTFQVLMNAFDANGGAGTIGVRQGNFFHLRQNFDDGDNGEPAFSSTGGWGFRLLPDEECPADTCADLP